MAASVLKGGESSRSGGRDEEALRCGHEETRVGWQCTGAGTGGCASGSECDGMEWECQREEPYEYRIDLTGHGSERLTGVQRWARVEMRHDRHWGRACQSLHLPVVACNCL